MASRARTSFCWSSSYSILGVASGLAGLRPGKLVSSSCLWSEGTGVFHAPGARRAISRECMQVSQPKLRHFTRRSPYLGRKATYGELGINEVGNGLGFSFGGSPWRGSESGTAPQRAKSPPSLAGARLRPHESKQNKKPTPPRSRTRQNTSPLRAIVTGSGCPFDEVNHEDPSLESSGFFNRLFQHARVDAEARRPRARRGCWRCAAH